MIVAGGAPSAPFKGDFLVGYVEVYRFDELLGKWSKMGQRIYGKQGYEGFGKSVELSEDGYTLVVGAPDKAESKGAIRVFKYSDHKHLWVQMGGEMEGDGAYDYWGDEVAASANGRIIVSGGNNYKGLEQGAGHARAYLGV